MLVLLSLHSRGYGVCHVLFPSTHTTHPQPPTHTHTQVGLSMTIDILCCDLQMPIFVKSLADNPTFLVKITFHDYKKTFPFTLAFKKTFLFKKNLSF